MQTDVADERLHLPLSMFGSDCLRNVDFVFWMNIYELKISTAEIFALSDWLLQELNAKYVVKLCQICWKVEDVPPK